MQDTRASMFSFINVRDFNNICMESNVVLDANSCCLSSGEFLYQEYRDKSTQHEIEARRLQDNYLQTPKTPDSPKPPEEGSPPPTEHQRSNSTFSRLQNPSSGFNLWQDLPEIKNSRVLTVLQPQEIKLQEVRM